MQHIKDDFYELLEMQGGKEAPLREVFVKAAYEIYGYLFIILIFFKFLIFFLFLCYFSGFVMCLASSNPTF